tara:strand:+ start:633 stop:923 length:291 start_codon:yes stop_codon:yes gene_type:complete
MILLFTSADTILSLPRVLGVIVATIILVLEVICLIGISFRHIIPHHVASGAYQFVFSLMLLGLVDVVRSYTRALFGTLLLKAHSFLIQAVVDQFGL